MNRETTIAAVGMGALGLLWLTRKASGASGIPSTVFDPGGFGYQGNPVPAGYEPPPSAPAAVAAWESACATVHESGFSALTPRLIMSIIWQESTGNAGARGAAGEIGLMQLMPATAGDFGYSAEDLKDPLQNIRCGVRYLDFCMAAWDSDLKNALRAYNAGVTGSRNNPMLARGYANGVLNKFAGTPSSTSWF